MKQKFTLIIMTLLALNSFSQSLDTIPNLFEVMSSTRMILENDQARSSFDNIMRNPINHEVRQIKFNNLAENKNNKSNSYFKFSLPQTIKGKKVENILVVPTQIRAKNSDDYTYEADLIYGKEGKGSLVLIHKNGENYGSMKIGDRYFRIESLGKGNELLVEVKNTKEYVQNACGTLHSKKPQEKQFSKSSSVQKSTSCTKKVRVLVLYTDNADAVSNPTQLASTLIAETNSALYKSKIYSNDLYFQLVGVQSMSNFIETNNVFTDLNGLVTNNDVINQRNNLGADLVVMLTDGNYQVPGGFVLGLATLYE